MNIFAVMMVRNEADIIRVNILHHLAQGVDHFLVVDNGSSDETVEILTRLAERLPFSGLDIQARTSSPKSLRNLLVRLAAAVLRPKRAQLGSNPAQG